MQVSEYYQPNACVPSTENKTPCSFSNKPLIMNTEEKLRILTESGYEFPDKPIERQEAMDWIQECPLFILERGTTICHATKTEDIFRVERGELYTTDVIAWWKKYMPGHSDYNGAWFTYETEYGGPAFGMVLFYRVTRDIPILFIPNFMEKIENGEYFPRGSKVLEKIARGEKLTNYTGSHVGIGVKNWKEKGYTEIVPKYYADEMTTRLVKLGFPGYISCDECEVFIRHGFMATSIDLVPYKFSFPDSRKECRKCEEGLLVLGSSGKEYFCPKCMNTVKKEDAESYIDETIFDILIKMMCPGDTDCPLSVKQGKRNDVVVKRIEKSDILKMGLNEKQFAKKLKAFYLS